jgi:hypothetical protein
MRREKRDDDIGDEPTERKKTLIKINIVFGIKM